MDVSIIIVSYNSYRMTSDCISSIIEKTSGISYEIIVVDNASSDCSRTEFEKDGRIKYIFNEENIGFGRANNKGVKIACGRHILFLNNDTLLRNNAVRILSDFLDSHPDVGACGGNLYDRDGHPMHSFFRYLPSVFEEIDILLGGIPGRLLFGRNQEFNYSGKPLEVGHITGADLMVKKTVLDETGCFDPSFFMYYEDTELCYRISRAGYGIVSVPEASITHLANTTVKRYYDEFRYFKMLECSRKTYFTLTHSSAYIRAVDILRRINYFVKTNSLSRDTRERWRKRAGMLKQIKSERHDS